MASPLHATLLHSGAIVTIHDVRCTSSRRHAPVTECSRSDDLVFTRRGAFLLAARGQEAFADAGTVLFFNRGEPYRVTHPVDGGDDCTVLTFRPDVLAEALGGADSRPAGPGGATFAEVEAPLDASLFAALLSLRPRPGPPPRPDLAWDETALQLLAGATVGLRHRARRRSARPPRADTARSHREAVHAVRARLARDFTARHTLVTLAAGVGLSPFHLARVFARETGSTIHRHVTRLRLRAALERLADGGEDITRIALDLGFASHSHFTDAFRRQFGLPPSGFRREARRRATSRNPEARGRRRP